MTGRPTEGLGEIALSVNDLEAVQRFYADVVGLELMKRFEHGTRMHGSDRWPSRPLGD